MKKILSSIIFVALLALPSSYVHALSVVVHVPEKYTLVESGERFYFEIDIKYPENPIRKDLRLEYKITREGELIVQSKVLKAVETQASFIDFIVIPEDSKKGIYLLDVIISDYEYLREEVSTTFKVTAGKGDQTRLYFFILLGVIILMAVLIMTNLFLLTRQNKATKRKKRRKKK